MPLLPVKSFPRPSRSFDGLTLIELLVVVAIVGFLVAITQGAVNRALSQAKTAKSISNMKQVATAVLSFSYENNARLPSAGGIPTENNWVVALRAAGYGNVVGTSTTQRGANFCPMAMACRPANLTTLERMFAMNYFASIQRIPAIEQPSKMALLLSARWNPAGNWNQTEVGAGNGTPNYLPDFVYPIRKMSATDTPYAGHPDPSTVVAFVDGHVALVPKSTIPDPAITSNTLGGFWGRK